MTSSSKPQPHRAALVAVSALLITAGLTVTILSNLGWDPTAFIGFGEDATAFTQYAEDRLGDVVLRAGAGHDGKFFFVQANDPWVTDPAERVGLFDFPVHRSRRMLYPLLAGGLGLFDADVIAWSLLISNIIWMAFGTWGAARLAQAMGGSPWWGLAFVLNLGLVFTLVIDGADILALALAIWAVAFLYEDRLAPALALLTASALAKEVMLVTALGVAVWLWTNGNRRRALYALAAPALGIAVWEGYLRVRLGPDPTLPGSFGLPFEGLASAVPAWIQQPDVLLIAVCLILLAGLLIYRWWVGRSLLSWSFVGFVPLSFLFTAAIWTELFDFTRALAPMLTASVLVVFVEERSARGRGAPSPALEQSSPANGV